jgi:hypothetical protein
VIQLGRSRLLRGWAATPYGERVLYRDSAYQAIIDAGAMSFLAVFLVRLGASNWLVGWSQALPALVMMLVSLPMGSLVQRQGNLVATTNWARFAFYLGVGSFALLPLLPKNTASYLLVIVYGIMFVPGSAGNIAFLTILGQVTTPERRPRMLSTRLAINGLVAAVFGILVGQWLSAISYPLNYQMVFLSAFLAGLACIYTLGRLQLPGTPADKGTASRIPPASVSTKVVANANVWREMWSVITGERTFRNYCLAAFAFRMAMAMPMALYSIYRVRELGASDWWIGILFTTERVLSVVVYLMLGQVLSRPAFRRWLWLSCVAAVFYPLTMSLARTPTMLLLPHICGGIFGSAMNIYLTNILYQVSPEANRPPFVAADAVLANLTSFAGPLLGTALAGAMGMVPAMLLIAGLRAVSGLSFWRLQAGIEA